MRVSIVTISFNQAEFLEQAITSVLSQDYRELEYIVVDPGSTDGSREIIQRYRRHLDKVILEPDFGPANGLNKGFGVATGQVFGCLNADDLLLRGSVRRVAAGLARGGIDVVSGHGYVIDSKGRTVSKFFSWPFTLRYFQSGAGSLFQQGTFFSASAFREAGGFNEKNRTCWDLELFVDMAMAGARFGLLNEYLAAFRVHADSITGSAKLKREYESDLRRIRAKVAENGYREPSALWAACLYIKNRLANPFAAGARVLDAYGRWKRSASH